MDRRKKIFLVAVPAIMLIIFLVLNILSHGAAAIFNQAMKEQNMLLGEITVEEIQATPFGEVSFTNLLWKDARGGTILEIPEGGFKVKILDIIMKNFQSTTIKELYLNGASISVNFDENMNVDFIHHSRDFNEVNQDMKKNSGSWEEKVGNFNARRLKKAGKILMSTGAK